MRNTIAIGGALVLAAALMGGRAGAEDTTKKGQASSASATSAARTIEGDKDLTWGPPPPGLPSGGEAAVLSGDPGKSGVFTVRLKMPSNYRIMPHTHPTDEMVTIIKGDIRMGHGARFDEKAMTDMKAGGFVNLPAGHQHYVMCKSDCVVQVTAMGPFEITYVNPSDDPRKARASR